MPIQAENNMEDTYNSLSGEIKCTATLQILRDAQHCDRWNGGGLTSGDLRTTYVKWQRLNDQAP